MNTFFSHEHVAEEQSENEKRDVHLKFLASQRFVVGGGLTSDAVDIRLHCCHHSKQIKASVFS